MNTRRLALAATFALIALCSQRTHAQYEPLTPRAQLEQRIRKARRVQMPLATIASSAVIASSLGLLRAPLLDDRHGPGVLLVLAIPALNIGFTPTFSAAMVQWIGRRNEIDGPYLRAWGFGLLGGIAGAAVGATAGALLSDDDWFGVALPAVVLGGVGSAACATRGYNTGARWRLGQRSQAFTPSVVLTPDKRGAILSASGSF